MVQSSSPVVMAEGPVPKSSFSASAALPSRSVELVMCCWSPLSISDMKRSFGSTMTFSLSVSSSGQRSGHRESASDWIILCPGVCTSLTSNSDR